MLKLSWLIRQSWLAGGVHGYNSERRPPKDYSIKVWSQLAKQFQRRTFLNIFPIGSYVKTKLADSAVLVGGQDPPIQLGNLGWRVGSSDIILNGDQLRTIPLKFGPNWLSSFREEDF